MFSLRSLQSYRVAHVTKGVQLTDRNLVCVHTHKLSPAHGDDWELHTGHGLTQAARGSSDYINSRALWLHHQASSTWGFSSKHLSPVILLGSSLGSIWIAILQRYNWILAMNYKIT